MDEIGDMSLKTQAKILRVLQEQKFHRVGGSRTLDVNIRVIAASNKNLEKEIEKGRFREDLYYRLNVVPIHVPPLRERLKDLPLLAETFLKECGKEKKHRNKKLSDGALDVLKTYHWPGNVRELKNLLERLAIMVESKIIDIDDIPPPYNPHTGSPETENSLPLFTMSDLKKAKKAFEIQFIQQKLKEHGNNITQTAKSIGVGRSYLHKKIKEAK